MLAEPTKKLECTDCGRQKAREVEVRRTGPACRSAPLLEVVGFLSFAGSLSSSMTTVSACPRCTFRFGLPPVQPLLDLA